MKHSSFGLLLITLLAFPYIFKAQEKQHPISLETQFDIFNKSNTVTPYLKFRYFFNESNALRLTAQITYSDETRELFETDGDGIGTVQNTNSLSNISLGYERHIVLEKVSPYIGGEFSFGFGSNQSYGSRTDSTVFINDFNYSSIQKISQFGVHVFTGFDVPIYKGLFVGSELGFYFMNTNYKRGEFTTEDASSTTDATTTTSIPSVKLKSLSLVNMGVIRLGWRF